MPLQDLVGLRQADAVAIFLGGEVELENLVLDVLWYAHTLIADLGNHTIAVAACRDRELATVRHGLDSVQHDVEQGLLHEIEVRLDEKRLLRHIALDGDAMLPGIGSG